MCVVWHEAVREDWIASVVVELLEHPNTALPKLEVEKQRPSASRGDCD